MANTFDLIQTFTASSGGSAYADFINIPQTYTDLRFIVSSRNTDIYNEIHWTINGSAAAFLYFQAVNTTRQQDFSQSSSIIQGMVQSNSNSAASQFGAGNLYVANYRNTNMKKIAVGYSAQAKASSSLVSFNTGATDSTTSVTSMRATSSIGNLAEGTTIYLYGIKNE